MKVDKKDNYLTGKLLLAMPAMGDPRFDHAVIFICAHDENGAMGLMINIPIEGIEFKTLLEQLNITSEIKIDRAAMDVPVMNGGPVEAQRGFLLHANDFEQSDTIKIDETYRVTGTVEALKEIARGGGPEQLVFMLGYAGWSAGQLDKELQNNAWLVVDADEDIVFHNSPEEKWARGVKKLGIDPSMLTGVSGNA